MRNAISSCLFLLVCLLSAAAANAQFMTPHYIVAFTQSKDATGTIGTVTVTITGYATVVNGVPPTVRHTPSAFLTIDGVGGTAYGTPVCPSCNVYATKSLTAVFDDMGNSCFLSGLDPSLGCYDGMQTSASLQCTQAGNLFTGGTNGYHNIEVKFSYTPVVPLSGTAPIVAQVFNNPTSLPITLTIAAATGTTGSATFDNGTPSTTITLASTRLLLHGIIASSTYANMFLKANVTIDSRSTVIGVTNFTVANTGGAVPVNFQQTNAQDNGDGTLTFNYTWESSSGVFADLSTCFVGELLQYPDGRNPWPWPTPPFPIITEPNPPAGARYEVVGNLGVLGDSIRLPNRVFVKPYSNSTFRIVQNYAFNCPYYGSNSDHILYGPIAIDRTVTQNTSGGWQYIVAKPPIQGKINPLP